jgi:hypothetical protein
MLPLCLVKHLPLRRVGQLWYRSTFHDLSTIWKRVVSFMPQPLCFQGKGHQYPSRSLTGPQIQSKHYGEPYRPYHVTISTELGWFSNKYRRRPEPSRHSTWKKRTNRRAMPTSCIWCKERIQSLYSIVVRGSHIFHKLDSQMALILSALSAGRAITPGRFIILIPVRRCVNPAAVVKLEVLCQLKNPMTSSGLEPATIRLVAYSCNQLFKYVAMSDVTTEMTFQYKYVVLLHT